MPKIIENLPQKLMDEVSRQLREGGYSTMTIRSVARECGVGVGTVYNYYRSKEEMVAAFLLADWQQCLLAIVTCSEQTGDSSQVLQAIYSNLQAFAQRHMSIFEDRAAAQSFAGSHGQYHCLLRSQLAAPLRGFCKDEFTAEFVAEAMLTWTMAGKTFEELNSVLNPLF